MTFEGFNVDWAWVDEPVPKYVYNGLWRGLQLHYGSIWFTLTPLGARCSWMYYDLYNDEDVWSCMVSQDDNIYLDEEGKAEFADKGRWSESERRARLFGEFQFLGNRVFEEIEDGAQIIPDAPIPPHWIHGMTVDPHHRKPAYIIWWAVDPATIFEPHYVFYREWPVSDFFKLESGNKSITDYANMIREIEGRRPADIRLVDPRFGKAESSVHGQQTTAWVDQMAECGLGFDSRVPNVGRVETGITKMRDMFRYDKNYEVSPTNKPRIQVMKSCHNAIKAIKNIGYMDTPEEGLDTDKLDEAYKDPVDAVRYTILYPLPLEGPHLRDLESFSERDLMEENAEGWQ